MFGGCPTVIRAHRKHNGKNTEQSVNKALCMLINDIISRIYKYEALFMVASYLHILI